MSKKIPKPALVFDFDGTISDYSNREKFRETDWDKYIALSYTDTPNKPIVSLIDKFKDTHSILIISARWESCRRETEEWLTKNNIYYDELILKPDLDTRVDDEVKIHLFREVSERYNIVFAVDDRPSCVRTLREHGYFVLQCGDGY